MKIIFDQEFDLNSTNDYFILINLISRDACKLLAYKLWDEDDGKDDVDVNVTRSLEDMTWRATTILFPFFHSKIYY